MNIYQAQYKVDYLPEALPEFLAGEAELKHQDGSLFEYRTSIKNFGAKKYQYNIKSEQLTVSVLLSRKYSLCFTLPILFIPVCLFTDLFTGPARDILLLSQGIGSIVFGLTAMLLPMDQPEFLHTDKTTARIQRRPYLRRTGQKVPIVVFFFLILGHYVILPWILPNPNIISILVLITIILVMFVLSRTSFKERTTPMLLFLLTVSALPVWLPVGNIVLLTQMESFRHQNINFLEKYGGTLFPESAVDVYAAIAGTELLNVVLSNIVLICVGIYFVPKLWDKIKSQPAWTPGTEGITHNKKVHLSLLLLYLAYTLASSAVLVSYFIGSPVVQIESSAELVVVFFPAMTVGLIFSYYRCKRYIRIRRERLSYSTELSTPNVDNSIDIFITNNMDVAAFSVNHVFSEPRIVINEQLIERLDKDELAAIYFHEVYHIDSGTSSYQQIVNIPVIGPIFFLAFINPENVSAEEFRADEFAAQKVGKQAVISAIERSAEIKIMSSDRSNTTNSDVQKISEFLVFITTIPVIGMYRPTFHQRIQNLKE